MKILQPRRFHPLKAGWVLLALVAYTLYTTQRDQPARLWKWSGQTMGAGFAIQVVDRRLNEEQFQELTNRVEALLQDINAELSTWLPDSAVSRFNASTSTEPYEVSALLAEVTRTSLEISALSEGVFDITGSPLFDLWGFGKSGPKHVPDEAAIAATRQRCGYTHLSVPDDHHIQKAVPTLQVVYNAIVPGFAADQITALLKANGLTNTYVDVGGEILVRGLNQAEIAWRLGIETPDYDAAPGASVQAVLHLSDRALATSGDYRNYFRNEQGEVFSHIFDPRTGRPATTKVASVSVIADSGARADALATTLFVMGPDEGLPWLAAKYPDVHALFILRDSEHSFREVATPGFENATGYHPTKAPVAD